MYLSLLQSLSFCDALKWQIPILMKQVGQDSIAVYNLQTHVDFLSMIMNLNQLTYASADFGWKLRVFLLF